MSEEKELPKGWIQIILGDVLPIQYGKGLVENSRDPDGRVPVYGSSGIIGFHNQALTSGATLIIGRKGSIGSIHCSPVPCWPIDTTYFAEASTNVDLKFFLYLLSSLGLDHLDKSTAIPGLSRDDYNAVMVKIAPLPEQKRIVAALEQHFTRLDTVVATLQHNKAMLKRARTSVLKAAVEGQLTEAWRAEHPAMQPASRLLLHILMERRKKWEAEQLAKMEERGVVPKDDKWKEAYKEPVGPDVEGLPKLPGGWCWATVEQLAATEPNSITDGPFGSNLKTEHYQSAGGRVIRLQNIGDGEFKDEKAFISFGHFETLRKHQVFAGDIVIAALGEKPPRSCVIPDFVGLAIVKADCIRYKVSTEVINIFVNYALNAESTRKQVASHLHGIGRPRLNLTEIKSIVIPLCPYAEQQQIIAEVERRFSIINQLEAAVEASLKRIKRFRQSILKKAFAGQFVLQDPNDEPASLLLERICEERKRREQEDQQRRKEERMKNSQNPGSVRAKKMGKQRTPLAQVLVEAKKPLPPDDLFRRAGLQQDVIEDVEVFFEETREAEGRQIKVTRPDTIQVFLEAVSE